MIKKRALAKSRVPMMMAKSGQRFRVVTQSLVDGEQWYTVQCNDTVGKWVRENFQKDRQWHEHQGTVYRHVFDISAEAHTMMVLKWV
jgi:hypothetical protein